jgi:hypothetical protein
MITPTLEKLILCGKAFYKTFVAGGTKHTLNISEDRFIIITDITYFPMNCPLRDSDEQNHNTQVAIYGERGYNHFIFRNYNNTNIVNANVHGFCSPVTINTFMLHEIQVGFSFCNAPYFINTVNGIANTENPGYVPPIDYGKDGDIGAIPVTLTADDSSGTMQNNFTVRPGAGIVESQQLRFPFDGFNVFNFDTNYEYPLMIVNYVEVLGSANNIQI